MFIYITFDSNGFVTDYKKVETNGWITGTPATSHI